MKLDLPLCTSGLAALKRRYAIKVWCELSLWLSSIAATLMAIAYVNVHDAVYGYWAALVATAVFISIALLIIVKELPKALAMRDRLRVFAPMQNISALERLQALCLKHPEIDKYRYQVACMPRQLTLYDLETVEAWRQELLGPEILNELHQRERKRFL